VVTEEGIEAMGHGVLLGRSAQDGGLASGLAEAGAPRRYTLGRLF